MNASAIVDVLESPHAIACAAQAGLLEELHTWPKPGLVSHHDSGSHTDMDAQLLRQSIETIVPYFAALARAGQEGAALGRLRLIGIDAEVAMLRKTGGVNTHRGAIFALGLLCAAAGRRCAGIEPRCHSLGQIVSRRWRAPLLAKAGRALSGERSRFTAPASHGERMQQRHGAGGARAEAAGGFRSAYEIGMPALLEGARLSGGDCEAARVHALFALLAAVADTNLLFRGGLPGLTFAQSAAHAFLAAGGVGQRDWQSAAAAIHAAFIDRGLSPGGCADLLAISLFLQRLECQPP